MIKRLCFVVLCLCCAAQLFGQQLDSLIIQTQKLFDQTENELVFPKDQHGVDFSVFQASDSTIADYQIALKEAQIDVLKADFGLAFNASSQLNTRGNLDVETNAFTTSRVKTELQWNILKSGFGQNRNRIAQIKNDIESLNLEKQLYQLTKWRRQFRVQYNYSINQELIELFSRKEKFLEAYYDIAIQLYADKLISRETIIDLGLQLSTCQTELKNTKDFNKQLLDSLPERMPFEKLPLVSIREIELGHDFGSKTSLLQEILKRSDSLKAENLELENHWTNNIKLDGYVNYNFLQTTIDNRNFASVGLRLSFPIRFKNQREVIDATDRLNKANSAESVNGQEHTRTTYYESYREKIRDLKNQHNNWQIITERKRVLWALKSEISDKQAGLLQLASQHEQFAILENCLRLKKQLYTALSHLYEIDPNIHFEVLTFSEKKQETALLNDDTVHSIEFYLAFAKAKNITTLYTRKTDSEMEKKFKAAGIKIIPQAAEKMDIRDLNEWIASELNNFKTTS